MNLLIVVGRTIFNRINTTIYITGNTIVIFLCKRLEYGVLEITCDFENPIFTFPTQFRYFHNGLFKVNLEFSFSIPGLFQTWNSNKPGFENLNSRSAPEFEKLNSRSELELSKIAIIK